MRFQKIIIREGFIYMAFVFMLSITAVIGAENELEERETLLAFLIEAGEINQETAQSLRSECRNELSHAKKILQDVELCFMKERSIIREELYGRSSRVKTQEALNVLCPQVKKMLVDCLRGKNFVFPFTGEKKDSDTWYSRYFESFQSSPRRRQLAEKAGEASDPMQTIILAVGVTASVTFIISILLFYFCCASSFASGRNDEKPLLSLSVSVNDKSIASQKSLNSGASANEEKLGSQSFNNGLGHTKSSGSLYMDSRLSNSLHSRSSGNLYLESETLNHSRSLNDSHSMNESRSLSISKKENSLGTNADDASNSLETSTQAPPPVFPPLKPPPGRVIPTSPSPVSSVPSLPSAHSLPSAPSAPTPPPPPGDGTPTPLAPMLPGPPAPRAPPPPASPNAPAATPALPGGAPVGPRPPGPPPPPGPRGVGPRPPGPPPPRGPPGPRPPRGTGGHHAPSASTGDLDLGANKTKLKPFFWDKVNASTDDSMVWNQIKAGSFQFNEEMIETLFGYAPTGKNKLPIKKDSGQESPKFIQIIDAKKAQNLSILLKALNVTTQEVRDALEEGNELPAELIQTLLKMAPTAEEELKLRLFNGELTQLGPAERFLKVMVDVPFAFKRLETIYFMSALEEESAALRDAFVILEAACTELRKNRLFLKLLEAVLKTGNRMNSGTFRGGAQAFKLDTLLKLSDVKGIDGKTTLLHFVVQEIIRGEGIRAVRAARELRSMSSFKSEDLSNDSVLDTDENLRSLGLQAVSRLGNDLENVKRAAALDLDNITGSVGKLGHALVKARDFLNTEMKSIEEEDKGFRETLRGFVENSEGGVKRLLEEEKRIAALIKSTADYFHGNSAKDEGLRLFTIVRDFLVILEKVCLEVKATPAKPKEEKPKEEKAKEDDKANASTAKDEKPSDSKPAPPLQVPAAIAKKLSTVSGTSGSSDDSDESDDSSSEDDEPTVKKIASRIITTPSPQQNSAIANRHPDSSESSGDSDESGGSDSNSDEDKPTAKQEPPHPATPQTQPNSAIANRRSDSQDDSDGTDGSNSSSEEEDKPNTSNTKEEEPVDAPPDSEKSTPAVAETVPDSSEESSADEDENEDKARLDSS